MNRRRFLLTSVATVVSAPIGAPAHQSRLPQVGVLDPGSPGADTTLKTYALRDGLQDLGWVDSQSVVLKLRFAKGDLQRLSLVAHEFVAANVDVIAAVGADAAAAARRTTGTIPIVMVGVGDPVRLGLVQNLGRPEGNVTGVSLLNQELWGKRLELCREIFPRLSRLGVLYQDTVGGRSSVQELRAVGRRLGLEVQTTVFRNRDALPDYFTEMRATRAEVVAIVPSPVLDDVRSDIAEVALKHRLPTILAFPEYVEASGFMAYGPSLAGAHRRAAYYVDKILRGAKPADLPVEQPTKLDLVLNLKTAKALGVAIPPSVLLRADQVIE